MTYKTIAVALDTGTHAAHRLDAAVELAERFNAHLCGVYSEFTLDPRFYYQAEPQHRYEVSLQALCRERHEQAEHAFRSRLLTSKVTHDWHANEMTTGAALYIHARHADLTIVSQHDSAEHDAYFADRYPDRTIMAAGGPVLIWPRQHARTPLDGTAVIAWDGSREAARAVFDALPILHCAQQIDIVTMRPERTALHADASDAKHLSNSLERHAIHASVVELVVPEESRVETTLMAYLQSNQANVLIMGAFHHTRLREAVFGGLTRAVLQDANVPVLMSN
ncbi:universal stress protein [Caballeronia sp. BR00000012568055]|uniref:universal stress protein n=1 Tax=Caballeronia sp. BR00000012568055 TaxID=2918761 RepID=UPI0023FA3443|nr:universal stress protein [Caballeronia sp. BR00000012568055]